MARALLAPLVHRLALASGHSRRRAAAEPVGRILMLHAVGPGALPAAQLDALLAWLARHFRVMALTEILAQLERGEPFTGREVALTFDDGQRCHAELVAPLLVRRQLPATFFLCPELMESGQWIWNQEARARLAALPAAAQREVWVKAQAPSAAQGGVEAAIAWLKTLAPAPRQSALAPLHERTSHWTPNAAQQALYAPLSVSALQALDARWISIGSHSLTHPILTTLSQAELEREVEESRGRLESWLGRPVEWFCYPNGSEDERVRAAVAAHYRAAVTTEPGKVQLGDDPHGLARVGVAARLASTAWRMVRP